MEQCHGDADVICGLTEKALYVPAVALGEAREHIAMLRKELFGLLAECEEIEAANREQRRDLGDALACLLDRDDRISALTSQLVRVRSTPWLWRVIPALWRAATKSLPERRLPLGSSH